MNSLSNNVYFIEGDTQLLYFYKMQEKFLAFIASNNLIGNNDKVLLAVSGGVDSIVMAHLFNASNHQYAIAHCNFQLREQDSDEDEEFVKQLASELKVPFHTVRFDTQSKSEQAHISTQMAARELRYEWFAFLVMGNAVSSL